MTFSAHRRILAAVLVGAAFALGGCAVPGQPAPAGAAAAFEDTTISNETISSQYSAWRDEGDQGVTRRSVVTTELLREPLLQRAEEVGLQYHRSTAQRHAQVLLQMQGSKEAPSEALVDAFESALLVAHFALDPQLHATLAEVAQEIEAHAATSPRVGDFSAERFMASVDTAHQQANSLFSQNMPVWFIAFRNVNGFGLAGAEWFAADNVAQ